MVIGGTEDAEDQRDKDQAPDDHAAIENHDDDDSNVIKQGASFRFSDHARARIKEVKCH